jgi:hypothetical protein
MKINVFITTKAGVEKLHAMGYSSIDNARIAGQIEVKKGRAIKYRLAKG